MTVEETQVAEIVVPEEPKKVVAVEESKKIVEEVVNDADSKPKTTVQKSSSYKEESNFLSDLKEFEKKALTELKSKLEEAILGNNLFKKEETKKKEKESNNGSKIKEKKEKPAIDAEKEKESGLKEGEKQIEKQVVEEEEKEEREKGEKAKRPDGGAEEEEKNKNPEEVVGVEQKEGEAEINKDISLWGIPLLPSKGAEGTDVILLKFLRAREFKVNDAFEMLKKTLQWRKECNIDSILDEQLEVDLSPAFYMDGVDRDGHPLCYNVYGVLANEELYAKAFGSEENRKQFLRWRFQLMEKGIQKLDFKPAGVSSLLQISDLKNSPPPSKKELRIAMNQVVGALQDNYPELVAKNIFINVPFWFYALNALLAPFLTQRSKSKFVVARRARVTETLLKYIPAEQIPVQYGGFKRENDFEFSSEVGEVSEVFVKAGSTKTIEVPANEVGNTTLWDLTVLGWEVNYKEEFVPADEGSYTIIIQKGRKMVSSEAPIRNTFRNNEPGKVALTIENNSGKKKRVLYRYKAKKCASWPRNVLLPSKKI